jgi:hypothetical protein
MITELETLVASTKDEIEGGRDKIAEVQATPPCAARRKLPRATGWGVVPSGVRKAKSLPGTEQPKLYSEALRGEFKQKRYKLTVTSKDSNSPDTIKDILKSRINPSESGWASTPLEHSEMGRFKLKQATKRT